MTARLPRLLTLVAALALAIGLLTTASSTATAAPGSTSAEDSRQTNFPGGLAVRRSSNVNTKLAPLPADYRRAARGWLERAYTADGSKPECADAPYLSVRSYHRSGFVLSSQGLFPTTGEPDSCAGGGYTSIWSKRGGPWREVISGQEAPSCRALAYHRVPRSLVDGCYDANGQAQDY